MATIPTTQNPSASAIHSETKRIIKANSLHFLAFASLFPLPISVCTIIIYPTLCYYLNPLIPTVVLTILITLLFVFAVTTITHSTYHAFYARPLTFKSSTNSIYYSFFRLIATVIVVYAFILCFVYFPFMLVLKSIDLLNGVNIDRNHSSLVFVVCVMLVLFLGLVVRVHWSLAFAIVVVKCEWGLKALRQSGNLVRGMEWVSLRLLLEFLFCCLVLVCWYLLWSIREPHSIIVCICYAVVGLVPMSYTLLYYNMANTILYIYCKDLHGELGFEIGADESGNAYVSLPSNIDEENVVPQIVNVAHA